VTSIEHCIEPEEEENSRIGALPVARAPRGGGEGERRPVAEATVAARGVPQHHPRRATLARGPGGHQHQRPEVAGRAASEKRWSTAAGGRNPSHGEVFSAVIRGRGQANQGGGGVDQVAAYRLRLVAAEGATGAGGRRRGRRQGRLELASERRDEGWVVDRFD
jgi:hypothetical protein